MPVSEPELHSLESSHELVSRRLGSDRIDWIIHMTGGRTTGRSKGKDPERPAPQLRSEFLPIRESDIEALLSLTGDEIHRKLVSQIQIAISETLRSYLTQHRESVINLDTLSTTADAQDVLIFRHDTFADLLRGVIQAARGDASALHLAGWNSGIRFAMTTLRWLHRQNVREGPFLVARLSTLLSLLRIALRIDSASHWGHITAHWKGEDHPRQIDITVERNFLRWIDSDDSLQMCTYWCGYLSALVAIMSLVWYSMLEKSSDSDDELRITTIANCVESHHARSEQEACRFTVALKWRPAAWKSFYHQADRVIRQYAAALTDQVADRLNIEPWSLYSAALTDARSLLEDALRCVIEQPGFHFSKLNDRLERAIDEIQGQRRWLTLVRDTLDYPRAHKQHHEVTLTEEALDDVAPFIYAAVSSAFACVHLADFSDSERDRLRSILTR